MEVKAHMYKTDKRDYSMKFINTKWRYVKISRWASKGIGIRAQTEAVVCA